MAGVARVARMTAGQPHSPAGSTACAGGAQAINTRKATIRSTLRSLPRGTGAR